MTDYKARIKGLLPEGYAELHGTIEPDPIDLDAWLAQTVRIRIDQLTDHEKELINAIIDLNHARRQALRFNTEVEDL